MRGAPGGDQRGGLPLFSAVVRPIQAFFRFEAAGGLLMLGATTLALGWANSPFKQSYHALVELKVTVGLGGMAEVPLHVVVNDVLMAVFFFTVGMEIKRELVVGELRTINRALLPAIAALGGMIAPGLIYLAFNGGSAAARGWAVPMATDIAFAIGVVTLLKDRVPYALIVFLTALAIFDDLGGILVIALFYGSGVQLSWLLGVAGISALLLLMGRAHVRNGLVYGAMGALLWYAVHHAGIHAAISGVLLGLCVPARTLNPPRNILEQLHGYLAGVLARPRDEDVSNQEILQIEERLEELEPPLNRFVHLLHPWVAFGIVPLFALVNAGVDLDGMTPKDLLNPIPLGIALGLFVGKQLGIFAFTYAVVRAGWAPMPGGGSNRQLWGVATVGGIGFTVALFVANLAFAGDAQALDQAKLGILTGSLLSAVVGYLMLRLFPGARPRAASRPAHA
jgi:Na+:H+ antiporter, NhaA family